MRIDNFTPADFRKMSVNEIRNQTVIIEKGLDSLALTSLNDILMGCNLKLVLVCDISRKKNDRIVANLDVLSYLPNLQRVSILSNSSKKLDSIDQIDSLEKLTYLQLGGNIEKNLSLIPISNQMEIEELTLEFELKKQHYEVINNFKKLQCLSVSSLDLKYLSNAFNSLMELSVSNSFKGYESVNDFFKNLSIIKLKNCSDIDDFSFVSEIESLKSLSCNTLIKLKTLPPFSNNALERIELLNNINLENINSLNECENLSRIALTDSNLIDVEQLINIVKDKEKLETLYYRCDRTDSMKKITDFSNERNLKTKLFGFWN